jgi:Carboxypeptidase regulatory-like domain
MTTGTVVLTAALFVGTAWAGDNADHAKLGGAWQVQSEAGKGPASVWVLEEKGDAVHITYSRGDQKLAEFECNAMGRECEIKDSGKQAKVSMWYSGPKLVELETRGSEVVKRRFAVSGQGDTMELEVIPIVPSGPSETKLLKRLQASGTK